MPLELLQVAAGDFIYAALFRDRALIDLAVDRAGEAPLYQSIWKVKIDRSLPDVGAFVRLGEAQGLLRDTPRRSGDEALVQLKSRRSRGKADIVSQDIALTGLGFIYLPNAATLSLSRRLAPAAGARLHDALAEAGVTGGIVRSAAAGMDSAAVLKEAARLRSEWETLQSMAAPTGTMLRPGPDAATRLLTDYAGEAITRRAGTLEDYDLHTTLAALASPRIDLPRGGSVMLEPTAALTAIDINAGPRSPAEVNREAVALIATEIRLRNLSGLILIDFAGGKTEALLKPLAKALAADPAGCRLGGLTPAGLVELTRARRDLPLAEKLAGRT